MDINAAIQAYSHSFGNRMEELLRMCDGDQKRADTWAEPVRMMQDDIVNLICAQSERRQLSAIEIEHIASVYLSAHAPEVTKQGLRGLMDYVGWMAWHEGYLATEQN
jgi:hypothetical protein